MMPEAKHASLYGKGHPSNLGVHLKLLSPKQMLKRLPIAYVQIIVKNTSENLKNEIHQIIYFLYQAKLQKNYITI